MKVGYEFVEMEACYALRRRIIVYQKLDGQRRQVRWVGRPQTHLKKGPALLFPPCDIIGMVKVIPYMQHLEQYTESRLDRAIQIRIERGKPIPSTR